MEEIDIYLHNHVIWKKNMPNQNFKGVYTWILPKLDRLVHREHWAEGLIVSCRRPCWPDQWCLKWRPVACFTKEVNPRLAKRPLVSNGRLANRGSTSLVKEATGSCNWNIPLIQTRGSISVKITSYKYRNSHKKMVFIYKHGPGYFD